MSAGRNVAQDTGVVALVGAIPHAAGYTLDADAFMPPSQNVGFSIAHQQMNVFPHRHDFYELALVTEGTGLHKTSMGEQRIGRGHVIFVVPGVEHGYGMGEGLTVYNCFLRAEAARFDLPWTRHDAMLAPLFGSSGVEPRTPLVLTLETPAFDECLAHLEEIRRRPAEERSEAYDLGRLLLALDVVARAYERSGSQAHAVNPRVSALVARAIDLLEHDLARHWTLDELAGRLFVGRFHLVRQFDRIVGLPPISYLNQRRVDRAATLLATTDAPIAAIGADVGWPDPSHFSRRFHRRMGISPRAYRESSRAWFARNAATVTR